MTQSTQIPTSAINPSNMKTFNSEEIDQIKRIVNERLNDSTLVHSIHLTVSKPVVKFGDAGLELEDLILYDVVIKYGEEKNLKLKNLDLSEDTRDAATILTDKIEYDMK